MSDSRMAGRRDSEPAQHDIAPLLAGYRPLPGIFDEMMDRDGRVRSHWRSLLAMFAALGPKGLGARFAAADRHVHDSGVFYRVYEETAGTERPWPLSHVPLLIDASEWQRLKAGLVQRAELLEAVLADSYGPARLVRERRVPATVIAGNPEYLRPLVGVVPAGGAYLRFYAVDVGRSPDGHWWVLGDRTQAPSGAGYALENRLALSRAMPDIYRELKVERLAPFFQAVQAELAALNRRDDSRVCVLTPGPLNETYFEHAYLARYLGFLLVEGEDLTCAKTASSFARCPGSSARKCWCGGSTLILPTRSSSMRARASACPDWCRPCATAWWSLPTRSVPGWSRRGRC